MKINRFLAKFFLSLGFITAFGIVTLLFITAHNYSQLAMGTALYPALILTALNVFPRKTQQQQPEMITNAQPTLNEYKQTNHVEDSHDPVQVDDFDKRAFIKLIGATGISFFVFSLLGRRAESFIFGEKSEQTSQPATPNNQSALTGSSPTEGYKISEIDEGQVTYFGFTNKEKGWLVMKEDADGNTFRYAKGDSDFPGNWANRQNLKYDYFYNLF